MEEWKESFYQIYQRYPNKNDMDLAPEHLKPKIVKETAPKETTKKGVKRKAFGIARPQMEEFSPIKMNKRSKVEEGNEEDEKLPKVIKLPMMDFTNLNDSPQKSFKPIQKISTGRKIDFDAISPRKCLSPSTSGLSPVKSPVKQVYQRKLVGNREIGMLLIPTPEKTQDDELEQVFEDESGNVKKTNGTKRCSKKLDLNFQKINLRKKTYQRGKLSAEQKRKLRRKQKFRSNKV